MFGQSSYMYPNMYHAGQQPTMMNAGAMVQQGMYVGLPQPIQPPMAAPNPPGAGVMYQSQLPVAQGSSPGSIYTPQTPTGTPTMMVTGYPQHTPINSMVFGAGAGVMSQAPFGSYPGTQQVMYMTPVQQPQPTMDAIRTTTSNNGGNI